MSTPVVWQPGDGIQAELWKLHSTTKAGREATEGAFTFAECVAQAGMDTRPLHHHTEIEAFYVLEGTLTVHLEDRDVTLPPGGFAMVPSHVRHAFSNGTAPTKFLVLYTPGGFEAFWQDMQTLAQSGLPRTPERVQPLWMKHGICVD
jgi:mannose-6-phosphate isomerase-like protein (cupin superfamily)